VIYSFRHKGLKVLFEKGNRGKVPQQSAERITRLLDALDAAKVVQDMNLPGFDLHELKGDRKGTWAIRVTGNLRITFVIENGEVRGVNLEDYH
jgi:toxin HigB-1